MLLQKCCNCIHVVILSPSIDMVPTDSPSLLPVPSPVRTSADNLTLSCTVAGEGRFSWQWTDPDGNPPSAVILSNVTRTSIATFTNIRLSVIKARFSCTLVNFTCRFEDSPSVPERSYEQSVDILGYYYASISHVSTN